MVIGLTKPETGEDLLGARLEGIVLNRGIGRGRGGAVVLVADVDMLSPEIFNIRERGPIVEAGINFDFDNVTFEGCISQGQGVAFRGKSMGNVRFEPGDKPQPYQHSILDNVALNGPVVFKGLDLRLSGFSGLTSVDGGKLVFDDCTLECCWWDGRARGLTDDSTSRVIKSKFEATVSWPTRVSAGVGRALMETPGCPRMVSVGRCLPPRRNGLDVPPSATKGCARAATRRP